MKIYALTPLGKKLARSISNPDTMGYRIVHFLDKVGGSTTEQIADYTGMSTGEASAALGLLRRKKVVNEVTETTI